MNKVRSRLWFILVWLSLTVWRFVLTRYGYDESVTTALGDASIMFALYPVLVYLMVTILRRMDK